MSAVPFTFERHPETRVTNITLGVWLFLASEAMFFASLFSAYVLLRTGSAAWPDERDLLSVYRAIWLTLLLGSATRASLARPLLSAGVAGLFLATKLLDYVRLWQDGIYPATNLMAACWYVLTGLHWLHVAGGAAAALWFAFTARRVPPLHQVERLRALRLYWLLVDLVWIAILAIWLS